MFEVNSPPSLVKLSSNNVLTPPPLPPHPLPGEILEYTVNNTKHAILEIIIPARECKNMECLRMYMN